MSPSPSPPDKDVAPASAPSSNAQATPDRERCANCDAELSGAYCTVCGQRAGNRVVPLWQVTNEFLEDLFDLDLRILKTFPIFFFRPGRLTVEYVRGRRRRYIRPLRLYLFSSFLLFTVLAFTNLSGFSFSFAPSTEKAQAEVAAARAEIQAARAELQAKLDQTERGPQEPVAEVGAEAEASPPDAPPTGPTLEREMMAGLDQALASLEQMAAPQTDRSATVASPALLDTVGQVTEAAPSAVGPKLFKALRDPSTFVRSMIDRAPYLMFGLVPTFALLLKLMYLRRRRLYLEHLIFALHVHALAFIAFALSAGLGALELSSRWDLDWWMAAAPFGYLFVAMRRVYGQSLGVTALKALGLLFAYGIILVAALVLLVMVTVAFG